MAWEQTRNDIIKRALRIIGVLEQGDSPDSHQLNEAIDTLNGLLKSLSLENIWLWKIDWFIESLSASSEVTGTDGKIYTCIRGHTSSSENQPVTGSQYKLFWKESGTTGGVWADATAYNCIETFYLGKMF